ncbi:ASCH domain-containing protein [Pseudomonas putida]|nr:ASCH domain-containing protein [Pseudomonas putida]
MLHSPPVEQIGEGLGAGQAKNLESPWKALSVRQPWAAMIVHLGKDIENRSRHTNFRGRFLIHASKSMPKSEWLAAIHYAHHTCGVPVDRLKEICDLDKLQHGGFVGSVELVDSLDKSDSTWYMGEKGFLLREPQALPFVRYSGQLGFFNVPRLLYPSGI